MNKVNFPVNNYDAYHAHVYFDKETFTFAKALCEKAGELFQLQVGRAHQKLVGPHPRWSCQLLFTSSDFEQLIPWLKKNAMV
ncbi:DOPA 4,5-dioxygenase family protein [Psychromonas aquatilis]|uniref:DOPA 4,5-dioxygenase family protein n=1 Tax=Psychromonas aquatilis TaxID=2005072 RepID=A0ABU9GU86_9GAMM